MARNKEYEMAIKIAGEIEKSFYNSTKLTKKELSNIAKQASTTSMSVSQSFSKGLKEAAPVFNSMENAGRATFQAVAAAAAVAATAVAGVVAASVSVGASFEAQMSTVEAISGASASEMDSLNDLAKELGATTKFTATEVGQAMEYMAMAGWKTQDMLDGMSGVLDLAAASGEDLAITSDIVTDAMTAFGLGADQVGHFADVLAATATNSNTTVSMMGETFTYAASIAGAMGYEIEDVSVAIGLMANSGIKASQAGTALRKILTETTGGAKLSAKAFGDMTIATSNQDGSMRELADIIKELRDGFSLMSESEKAANAEAIAGKTGMSGLLAIVNAGEADYKKLTDAIDNCAGAAQTMADIRIDNLNGDVTIMKSALEGLGIQIYDDLNDPLRTGVQMITNLIGNISKGLSSSGIVGKITEKIPTAVRKIKELGAAVKEFSEPFFAVAGWLVDNPQVIIGAIAGIGTAIATYKVASGIVSITTALAGLGPVGLGIMAIGAVAGIITAIVASVKKGAEEAKKANLASHFGDITLSLDELREVAGHIIQTDELGQVQEAIASFKELDSVQQAIDDSVRAINKMNWKVSIGMQLSADEQEQYKGEIATYVEQCQKYITERQYAVNLAIGVLTDDDLEGSNIVNQVNQFYAGKQAELAELGTKLNETITEAFQDGLLDMDEVAEITQLQQQMARIQSAVAGSNFEAELDLLQLKYEGGQLDAETFKNLQAEIQEQMDLAIADYDEAYTLAVSSAKIMLEEGDIDNAGYLEKVNEFKENYLEQVGDLELKAANFQMDTIMSQYEEELSAAAPEFQELMNSVLGGTFNQENALQWKQGQEPVLIWTQIMSELGDASTLSKDTKNAIKELLDLMEPSTDAMEELAQKYKQAGKEVPRAIQEGLNDAAALKALIGDEEGIWYTVGTAIESSKEYKEAIDVLEEKGYSIPEATAQAINGNQSALYAEVDNLWKETKEKILKDFSEGVDVSTQVRVNIQPEYSSAWRYGSPIPGHAEGGIFDRPHLAWFAEDGMEAAIPIDGSQNAMQLWRDTGELLGIEGITGESRKSNGYQMEEPADRWGGDSGIQITFNPTLQFYGNAPEQSEIENALMTAEEEFEEMMEQWMRKNRRISFA